MKKSIDGIIFPTKRKGQHLKDYVDSFDPDWRQAINERAAELSLRFGRKVSMATLMRTAVAQQFPEVETRARQIKKEKQHAKSSDDNQAN